MKNKYTPGPWSVEHEDGRTHVTAGAQLACIYNPGHDRGKYLLGEAQANARLMAAAPRLLEALQKVIAISDRKHDAWDEAKVAIAKALGG